jgi:hypothetical protein
MSPRRFVREAVMLLAVVGGAAIGFAASTHMSDEMNMTCAFVGMASLGAFADFCIRGGK